MFEKLNGTVAVICVAIVSAVGEVSADFPEVACRNPRLAFHAHGMSAGCPAVDNDESHGTSLI